MQSLSKMLSASWKAEQPARPGSARRGNHCRRVVPPRICTSVVVYCRGLYCSGSAEIALDTLALPEDTAIIHIAGAKPFVCKRCGCREVEVRAVWPDPREVTRRASTEPTS